MLRNILALLIVALLINSAWAACPVTVQTYMGSTSGEVYPNSKINYHESYIFQNPPGSVYNVIPTPKLSILQPLRSASDLQRLSHDDWRRIAEYGRQSRAASRPIPTGTDAQSVSGAKAEKLTSANFDALINCYLNQTKSDAPSLSPGTTNKASSSSTAKPASSASVGNDSNEFVYGELFPRKRENEQLFRDSFLENRIAQQNKTKFDMNAPIISPACISFNNWGTGMNHDVKQIKSTCKIPVAVTYCFFTAQSPNKCRAEKVVGWGTTNVIAPGGTALVIAGTETKGSRLKVEYYVCDMLNEDKFFCLRP